MPAWSVSGGGGRSSSSSLHTIEQAWKLLGALYDDERRAELAFYYGTGARHGEGKRARPRRDIDLVAGEVAIDGTKTAGSKRTVPVTPISKPFLELALAGLPQAQEHYRRWQNLRRDVLAACKRVGVPEVSLNDLRRSFATWHLEAGVSNVLVAKYLGHTTTEMVGRSTFRSIAKYFRLQGSLDMSQFEWLPDDWLSVSSACLDPAFLPVAGADGDYLGLVLDADLIQDGQVPLVYYFHENDPVYTWVAEGCAVAAQLLKAVEAKQPRKTTSPGIEHESVSRFLREINDPRSHKTSPQEIFRDDGFGMVL